MSKQTWNVAHYVYDAYYEPAEGGYYVETCQLERNYVCHTMKAARKMLKRWAREWDYTPRGFRMNSSKTKCNKPVAFVDEDRLTTKYKGEGSMMCIEREYAGHQRGYEPYC